MVELLAALKFMAVSFLALYGAMRLVDDIVPTQSQTGRQTDGARQL